MTKSSIAKSGIVVIIKDVNGVVIDEFVDSCQIVNRESLRLVSERVLKQYYRGVSVLSSTERVNKIYLCLELKGVHKSNCGRLIP